MSEIISVLILGGVDVDLLTDSAKLFSIVYATLGIPLTLIYLGFNSPLFSCIPYSTGQCAKAISSLFPSHNVFFAAFGSLLVTAIVLDIFERNDEDIVGLARTANNFKLMFAKLMNFL